MYRRQLNEVLWVVLDWGMCSMLHLTIGIGNKESRSQLERERKLSTLMDCTAHCDVSEAGMPAVPMPQATTDPSRQSLSMNGFAEG